MVQIENEIFTELYNRLTTTYSNIFVTSEYTPIPSSFPCVFIEESDNYAISLNGSNKDEVSAVTYEINVFSNLTNGRKTECKNIIKTIDDYMSIRGFRRTTLMTTPNEDTSVYRMTARYVASIQNNIIYRR